MLTRTHKRKRIQAALPVDDARDGLTSRTPRMVHWVIAGNAREVEIRANNGAYTRDDDDDDDDDDADDDVC